MFFLAKIINTNVIDMSVSVSYNVTMIVSCQIDGEENENQVSQINLRIVRERPLLP